ncbi:MAG: phospholipase [Deltaproteobacteria bacterium]|nr:phospholipase [Deltaproteobacteria bacterium]
MHDRSWKTIVLLLVVVMALAFPAPGDAAEQWRDKDPSVRLVKDGAYLNLLCTAIAGAKNEIVMTFFLFKTTGHAEGAPDRVVGRLAEARERGVHVRVILERSNERKSAVDGANEETAKILKEKGISVTFDSPAVTTHVKAVVIDRRYVFLGSHNMTNSALKYNRELSVFVDSTALAEEMLAYLNGSAG